MAGEPTSAPSSQPDQLHVSNTLTDLIPNSLSSTPISPESSSSSQTGEGFTLNLFRTRLQTDIDYHLTKLLALRAQWNATIPLLQLPPELLGEICMAYVLLIYDTEPLLPYHHHNHSPGSLSVSSSPGATSTTAGSHQFCVWFSWVLKITHICRHWRNVALSLPTMWSYIPSSRTHPKLMKLWIERSGDVALRAAIASGNPLVEEAAQILLGEYHRMHTLNVELSKEFYDRYPKEVWYHGPAKRLVKLTIGWPLHDFDGRNSTLYLPTMFSTEELGGLKQFVYDGSQFDWVNSRLPSGLTELRVRRLSTYPDLETPKEALDVLEALPNLKILSLKDAVPISKSSPSNPLGIPGGCGTLRTIQLPHIEYVELETNHPMDCAKFLACLGIPASASVRIECLIGKTEHARSVGRAVAEKFPSASTRRCHHDEAETEVEGKEKRAQMQESRFESLVVRPLTSGMLGVQILIFSPPESSSSSPTPSSSSPSSSSSYWKPRKTPKPLSQNPPPIITNGYPDFDSDTNIDTPHTTDQARITLDLIIPATGIGPFDPECDTLDLLLHLFQEMYPILEPIRQLDLDNPRLLETVVAPPVANDILFPPPTLGPAVPAAGAGNAGAAAGGGADVAGVTGNGVPRSDSRVFCTFAGLVSVEKLIVRGTDTFRLVPLILANPPVREGENGNGIVNEDLELTTPPSTPPLHASNLAAEGGEGSDGSSSSSNSASTSNISPPTSRWHAFHKLTSIHIQGPYNNPTVSTANASLQLDRIAKTLLDRQRHARYIVAPLERLVLSEGGMSIPPSPLLEQSGDQRQDRKREQGKKFSGLAREIWVDGALFESSVDLGGTSHRGEKSVDGAGEGKGKGVDDVERIWASAGEKLFDEELELRARLEDLDV